MAKKNPFSIFSEKIRTFIHRFEIAVGKAARWFAGLYKGASSNSRYIEAPLARAVEKVSAQASRTSGATSRFEGAMSGLVDLIRRWRLNYLFAAFFAGALGYELYLLSQAPDPSARQELLAGIKFTIYLAFIFFSISLLATSPLRPWTAIARGWMGLIALIRKIPGWFALTFAIFAIARVVLYLPASWYAGHEAQIVGGNFVLSLLYFIGVAFVTRAIYETLITVKPIPAGRSKRARAMRLVVVATAMFFLTALVNFLLSPVLTFVPVRFMGIAYQLAWLTQMLWGAVTVFVIPAVIADLARPVRTALHAGFLTFWIAAVTLILVSLPADIFSVGVAILKPRLPALLGVRIGIDVLSALVNAIVYFAAQATTLLLFVTVMKHYEQKFRSPEIPA